MTVATAATAAASRTSAASAPAAATRPPGGPPVRVPCRFLGWGAAVPGGRLTNADLEARLDTSDAWITERTGIRERRTSGSGETTASLATAAGRAALERAGVAPSEVDLVLLATTTADTPCPSTAAHVQHALGTRGPAVDVNAACAGFVYGLHLAAAAIHAGGLSRVLVIGGERITAITDPDDRATAILFGDGAGALLLEVAQPAAGEAGPGLLAVDLGGDGSAIPHLGIPAGDRYLRMDGQEVFRRATRAMATSCEAVLDGAGVSAEDVALFVPHQANRRIIDATAARLGFPADRVAVNIDRYGNTSAASVPMALAEALDAGRLSSGDLVLLSAVGAGLSWGSTLLRWGA
ncbi:MAG: ketoacyl-ACP synthase III [Actinobacteria bacterium]|nr:ketoacyl-ACP synthase III [Actinomycetota bacterium]